ncbi:MAG TPA: hypothetical protein VIV12_18115 [Streptosporangiaceae bacterium]
MRNIKATVLGALLAPALALTGGLAYASATSGSHHAVTRPAAASTVQAHSQHTRAQAHHNRCDWRYGQHRCGWRGHAYRHPAYRHHGYRHHGYRTNYRYQDRSRSSYSGYRGNWGYRGSGQYGSRWGNGSGCCRCGW